MVNNALEKAEAIRVAKYHAEYQQGFLEGIAKVAKAMLKHDESTEYIMEHTGLSEADINMLRADMGDS